MNAIKATNQLISSKYNDQYQQGNLSIVAIGKKGQDYYQKRNYTVVGNNNDLFLDLNFENTSMITDAIMDAFVKGDYDRVELVYNQFKNAAVQFITTEQLLPLPPAKTEESRGDNAEVNYIFEPTKEKIIEKLIPKSIKTQLYKAVLDSHASEHG